MADDSRTITSIDFRSVFPFTHLFRAFRVAIHPAKMTLSLTLLTLLYLGGRFLDYIWPRAHSYRLDGISELVLPGASAVATEGVESVGPFRTAFTYISGQLYQGAQAVLNFDLFGLLASLYNVAVETPLWAVQRHPVFMFLMGVWLLLLWAIFGGAISRIAAVHVARDEKPSVRQALRFSTGKLLSFLCAPLIPLMIVAGLVGVIATGGLLLYIPMLGPVAAALIFPLTLLVGVVITLVLVGTVGGMTLMYPTIAVEGSDSFDAISRSFSYVYARPWRAVWYALVAVVYGAVTFLFLRLLAFVLLAVVYLSESLLLMKDSAAMKRWETIWPAPRWDTLIYDLDYSTMGMGETVAAMLMTLWVYTVIGLLGAYVISFYFSSSTIIYYLLRQEVDATEMDEVDIDTNEEDFFGPAEDTGDGLPQATVVPEAALPRDETAQ